MARLTEQRLREIEERANKATPGPWHVNYVDDEDRASALAVTTCQDEIEDFDTLGSFDDSDVVIAITLLQNPPFANVHDKKWDENTEFIAHSREDVPDLLTEIHRLQDENELLLNACKAALNELSRMYGCTNDGIYLRAAKRYLRRAVKSVESEEEPNV